MLTVKAAVKCAISLLKFSSEKQVATTRSPVSHRILTQKVVHLFTDKFDGSFNCKIGRITFKCITKYVVFTNKYRQYSFSVNLTGN